MSSPRNNYAQNKSLYVLINKENAEEITFFCVQSEDKVGLYVLEKKEKEQPKEKSMLF